MVPLFQPLQYPTENGGSSVPPVMQSKLESLNFLAAEHELVKTKPKGLNFLTAETELVEG